MGGKHMDPDSIILIIYSRTSPLIKVIVYSKVANGGLPTFLKQVWTRKLEWTN